MPAPAFPIPRSVVRVGLGVRARLLDLTDLLLPAEGALWDLTAGMQRTKLAGVLVTSGLADALARGPQAPAELASELGLDMDVTERVLCAAGAARLVRLRRDGRVALARLGRPLAGGHEHSVASWAAYMAAPTSASAYAQLEAQLRDGCEPSGHRRAFGDSIWEHFSKHPAEQARFAQAMLQMTAIDARALARAYPWPRRGVVCDLAGGVGSLLAAILDRRPNARGILLDAPEVLAESDRFLRARGLAERVQRCPGDLFAELSVDADVYVLKWILHDWSDETCRGILGRVRACMPAKAKLVAIDQRRAPRWPNAVTAMVDLHMLVECEGGRERTPAEVHRLMRDAGLRPGRVRDAGLQMLVEGIAS